MSDTVEASVEVSEVRVQVGNVRLSVRNHGGGWSVVVDKPVNVGPEQPHLDGIESEYEATQLALRYGRALHIYNETVLQASTALVRETRAINDARRDDREAA